MPRVEIATVTPFWNSLHGLMNLLPSIRGHFKANLFIDGVYKHFPLTDEQKRGNGLSTDGSRLYIQQQMVLDESYNHNWALLDMPFKTEYEKRMRYLDPELLIRSLDVDAILIIDTDEYIEEATPSQWEMFYGQLEDKCVREHREHWNVYGIKLAEKKNPIESFQPHPRLWFKPWNMTYKPHSHYQFINHRWELQHLNDNYSQYPYETIEGIRIWHDDSWKSEDYMKRKNEYEEWLRHHEQQLAIKK